MAWARIDDGFDDHPKVLWLLEHDDGAAAIGLWTLCLTWAHRNTRKKGKTPGRLPMSLPRRYLGVLGRDAAKLLVEAGMWEPSDDGWQIHDFDQYLPTAETSEARSAAGKRGAAARWGGRPKSAGRDGNLLSGDGKPIADQMANDGNAMAVDSRDMTPEGFSGVSPVEGAGGLKGDGKLPFSDNNEPSGDGKRMASDGSRAPARRAISNEIAPTPTPAPDVPPSAGADKPRRRLPAEEAAKRQRHVGEIVAAFVDGATEAGLRRPPAPLRARVGKQAKAILSEDWPIDFLIGSARRMGAGEFSDLATQVRKDDAAAKGVTASRSSPAIPRPSTTDQRVAEAQALKARIAARNQEPT